jgi:hypothetical protein
MTTLFAYIVDIVDQGSPTIAIGRSTEKVAALEDNVTFTQWSANKLLKTNFANLLYASMRHYRH